VCLICTDTISTFKVMKLNTMLDKNMKLLYQFNSECKSKESQGVGVKFKSRRKQWPKQSF
jgi:hypothetical protein